MTKKRMRQAQASYDLAKELWDKHIKPLWDPRPPEDAMMIPMALLGLAARAWANTNAEQREIWRNFRHLLEAERWRVVEAADKKVVELQAEVARLEVLARDERVEELKHGEKGLCPAWIVDLANQQQRLGRKLLRVGLRGRAWFVFAGTLKDPAVMVTDVWMQMVDSTIRVYRVPADDRPGDNNVFLTTIKA